MSAPEYGRVFAKLREGCPTPWAAYTQHAFVEGLRDGTLPRASFLHYLVQDYVFLVHFARAWSLGVVKAETLDEMKICARTVDALVNHEMSLHVKTCAAAGISEAALFAAKEDVENLAYTRYVLDAGVQGDFLDLIAALAPCCFGYGEIGLRLAQTAVPDTPYAEWIATYADDDYQQVMADVGAMFDGAVVRRLGDAFDTTPRWAHLQTRFTTATELEVGFWDMGLCGA
ncbi:thiaminase II [Litoreibacter albidus]|uniref:Aminopyrimidine aminohydrolase n=1 Tax=Litoreibacter albidus TaxID=670155 RepID=A0A1H3AWL7_9RHOB|nr:thiaminase II [Litoreibacter albidus]SDX34112.1 thiaminase (transcriptional activator TenA) [Litoreibacter albidus]